MVRMRKVWEDYKLEYQSAFEKMQEEFGGFIQSIKQGQRLDILPAANYSHPPPYPQDVLPSGNLNVSLICFVILYCIMLYCTFLLWRLENNDSLLKLVFDKTAT